MLNILPNFIDESNLESSYQYEKNNKNNRNIYKRDRKSCQEQGKECTPLIQLIFTSLYGKSIISIILCIKVLEANLIPFRVLIIEARVHIALHLVKQVQIIHQLMKYMTSTALATSFISFNQFIK